MFEEILAKLGKSLRDHRVAIHKVFAGRPRDLEDVRSILLKNRDIDIAYVPAWLKDFGSASDGRNFLTTFEAILKEAL